MMTAGMSMMQPIYFPMKRYGTQILFTYSIEFSMFPALISTDQYFSIVLDNGCKELNSLNKKFNTLPMYNTMVRKNLTRKY